MKLSIRLCAGIRSDVTHKRANKATCWVWVLSSSSSSCTHSLNITWSSSLLIFQYHLSALYLCCVSAFGTCLSVFTPPPQWRVVVGWRHRLVGESHSLCWFRHMIRRERWGYGRFFSLRWKIGLHTRILSEASPRLEDPCKGGLREGWRGLEWEDDLQFRPSVFLQQPPCGRQGQPHKQKPADWQAGRAADGEIKGQRRGRRLSRF